MHHELYKPLASDEAQQPCCVAGTYDGGIVGWHIRANRHLCMLFAYTSHQGSVRALAMPDRGSKAGQWLVSGGVDEHIRMYDLRRRQESGELLYHKGTITCLAFIGSSHLLSGGEDGIVCVWRVHDWTLLHILGGHKGAVTSVAVHPSGKVTLSTARDRSLRVWDLVKGRCAYVTRLEATVESVQWSSDGSAYALVLGDRRVDIRQTADNKTTASFLHPTQITASCFVSIQLFLTASNDGCLRLFEVQSAKTLATFSTEAHCGRIKQIIMLNVGKEESAEGQFLTGSSDGKVILWSIMESGRRFECMSVTSLGEGVRITALAGTKQIGGASEAQNGQQPKEMDESGHTSKHEKRRKRLGRRKGTVTESPTEPVEVVSYVQAEHIEFPAAKPSVEAASQRRRRRVEDEKRRLGNPGGEEPSEQGSNRHSDHAGESLSHETRCADIAPRNVRAGKKGRKGDKVRWRHKGDPEGLHTHVGKSSEETVRLEHELQEQPHKRLKLNRRPTKHK